MGGIEWVSDAFDSLPPSPPGFALQANASDQSLSARRLVSTDPPYYDNIGYADLSDFFYVWLRPGPRPVFLQLFANCCSP